MRSISDKQQMTLKAATRRAVDMAGGGDSFQHVTRAKGYALSRYGSTNEENLDKFMPIDVAVEADIEAGSPIIAAAMAEMLGYRLVPNEAKSGPASVAPISVHDALKIANEAADVVKAITDALYSDNLIDAAEEKVITREIDEVMRSLTETLHRVKVRG